jgi:Ca2+/Na+ antiporter
MLIGIALMLVGAMAYALPVHQDFFELIPALAGIIIATGGLVGWLHDDLRKHMMHLNVIVAFILLLYTGFKLMRAGTITVQENITVISDVDTLALCIVFVYLCVKSFIAARQKRKEEKDSELPST